MNDVWTIQAALNWCQGYLERHGDENPRLSAQWLLSYATGLSRIEVYTNFDKPLSCEERAFLRDAVTRRGTGEPLQYIQGKAPFRYLMIHVRPGVLIPRPETELIVDEVIAYAAAHTTDVLDVVDCCTGSGCIACAIASEIDSAHVLATDISPEALEVARENVHALSLDERIDVREADLLSVCADESADVIATNPPYVPVSVMRGLPYEVAHFEPELALVAGDDGLDIFRRLLPEMMRVLRTGGMFVCELHETCLDVAATLARETGFVDVRIVNDLTLRPRFLVAYKEA